MKHFVPAIFLAAIWTAIVWVFLTPEVPDGHGFAHDRFSAMDQGGDGADRHGPVMFSGWLLGASSIAIFVGLLAWAAERAMSTGSPNVRRLTFVVGGLLFEGLFALMMLAYRDSLVVPTEPAFIGPFPAATSWLLFGVWMAPAFFIVLFVVLFNRWFLSPAAMARFEQLVEERRRE